ncbi:MAG: PorV/PorQ family protein [Candidatus Poribacteria bacterium]
MLQKKHALIIGVAGIMFLLLGFISFSFSAEIDAASYLRMGAGARSIGMGSAFTAIADDATSTLLNPGGLANVKEDYSLLLFTSKMSLDREHSLIAGTVNFGDAGAIGCALIDSGTKGIRAYSSADQPGEEFDASNMAIALSYGYGIKGVAEESPIENISFGGGIKILTESFGAEGTERTTGFGGLDVGVIANGFSDKISCGLTVRNLGGKVGDGTIPLALDLGVAYKLLTKEEHQAIVAFDIEKEIVTLPESTFSIRIGAEYWLKNTLAIRAGSQRTKDRRSLYAGFGVKVANIQLDYAFKPSDNAVNLLDDSNMHYVSLSYGYTIR